MVSQNPLVSEATFVGLARKCLFVLAEVLFGPVNEPNSSFRIVRLFVCVCALIFIFFQLFMWFNAQSSCFVHFKKSLWKLLLLNLKLLGGGKNPGVTSNLYDSTIC